MAFENVIYLKNSIQSILQKNTMESNKYLDKIINGYLILEKIGTGKFSSVYKAARSDDITLYAIKILEKDLDNLERQEFLIDSEIKILKECQSDYVIKLHESFEYQGDYCLVLQYCEDGNLQNYLKKQKQKKISQQEAICILSQIINGVANLHQMNVIHRDIKPANILKKEGKYKLADLGFVKILEDEKSITNTVIGTPQYTAPEILDCKNYGFKVDIWSIGVIFYEMIFGFLPFKFESSSPLKMKKVIQSAKFFFKQKEISQRAEDFIKKCLSINVEKRLNIKEALDHPIFHNTDYFKILPVPYIQPNLKQINPTVNDQIGEDILNLARNRKRLDWGRNGTLNSSILRPSSSKKLLDKHKIEKQISERQRLKYEFEQYTIIITLQKHKLMLLLNYLININEQQFREEIKHSRNITELRLLVCYRCLKISYFFQLFFNKKNNVFKFPLIELYRESVEYKQIALQFKNLYKRSKQLFDIISENLTKLQNKIHHIVSDLFKKVFKKDQYQKNLKLLDGFQEIDFSYNDHTQSIINKYKQVKSKLLELPQCKSLYCFLYIINKYEILSQVKINEKKNEEIQKIIQKMRQISLIQGNQKYWKRLIQQQFKQ